MTTRAFQRFYYVFFSFLYFSVSVPSVQAGLGIDASWHESLVMAIDANFTFGKDFIFNYGPLGFLNTGLLPASVSIWVVVAFQLLILIHFLFIIHTVFQEVKSKWAVAISATLLLLPWGFIADSTFTLYYFQLFWLFYCWKNRQSLPLFIVLILSLLIFYIKVNLSIISYGIFYASLLFFTFSKRISFKFTAGILAIHLLLTFAFSLLLHVDIPAYLLASFKIIDAYQDSMSTVIATKSEFIILFCFEAAIIGVIFIAILRNVRYLFANFYLYLLAAFTWFLHFKQAHTAISPLNEFGYFLFMPALVALLFLFADKASKNDFKTVFVVVLLLQLAATQFLRFSIGGNTVKGYLLTYPPNEIVKKIETEKSFLPLFTIFSYKNPLRFIENVTNHSYENNFTNEDLLKERRLPAKILRKIGQQTVDCMPWEISYIFFNRLNYNPRPVIQSYQANSDWLAKKNGERYASATAPMFVLARVESFREQNPFWIDKDAHLELIRRYTLVDTAIVKTDTLFLFERKGTPKFLNNQVSKPKYYQLNEEISIEKSNSLMYLKADVSYSSLGKLARLIFQPPYLYATVTYENKKKASFRIPPPILKGGILVNKKVTNQHEFALLHTSKNNENIVSIRFWSKYEWGFEKQLTVYTDFIENK
jgi:hypothetical protein